MSIRTRIADGLSNISKALIGGVDTADSSFAFNQQYGNYSDTRKLGKYKGIVYAAVNLISDGIGKYQPIFNKKMIDGHLEPINGHPFLDLLANPSKGVSQSEFLKAAETYYSILGEAFWYIPLGQFTRKPNISAGTEIVLLPPDKMGLTIDDQGEVTGYILNKANGEKVLFRPEEIGLDKTFNPLNPYRGYGIVEAAIDYIDTEESTRTFTKNFFRNNAAPAGIISIKGNIQKENFEIFARKWREQYEGTKNAGRTALIRQSDVEFTKTSLGLDQIDMQSLKDLTVGEVLRMFRVPKALLGEETQQGFGRASVETLEYIFAAHTLDPRMDKLDSFIQMLVNRYYPQEQIIVTHENIIPEDKAFELQERQAAVDVWLTRNEIRQEENLEDIEGGEVLRAPVMSVPLSDTTPTPTTPVTPPAKGIVTITKTVKKKTNLSLDMKEAFRLSLVRNQRKYERRFHKVLAPILEEQTKEILSNWKKENEKGINGLVKAVQDRLLDINAANRNFENALFTVEVAIADEQGNLALDFAGELEADFTITPEIEKFIRDSLSKMANSFNEQTLEDMGTTIADGLSAGESIASISRELEAGCNDLEGYRADRLARTETMRASNQATKEAYKQCGFTEIQWYAQPSACEACAEMDGTIVGVEENFLNQGESVDYTDDNGDQSSYTADYSDVETPPLHPNCECGTVPVSS